MRSTTRPSAATSASPGPRSDIIDLKRRMTPETILVSVLMLELFKVPPRALHHTLMLARGTSFFTSN